VTTIASEILSSPPQTGAATASRALVRKQRASSRAALERKREAGDDERARQCAQLLQAKKRTMARCLLLVKNKYETGFVFVFIRKTSSLKT
jgi:hypothetical protein